MTSWRCSKWMGGVTCQRPVEPSANDRKIGFSKRYEVRRFESEAEYAQSDLHPSRRRNHVAEIRDMRIPKKISGSQNLRRLRVTVSKTCPSSELGRLRSVPSDYKQRNPFNHSRRWIDGRLPSFKDMGAVGQAFSGGVVIYKK